MYNNDTNTIIMTKIIKEKPTRIDSSPAASFVPLIIRTEDIENGIIISNVVLSVTSCNSSTMFLIYENLAFEGSDKLIIIIIFIKLSLREVLPRPIATMILSSLLRW
jgi:hypothetical protein